MDKKLRSGFTTGSCAAAAAKAAAWMLLTGSEKTNISIITPKGDAFDADILDIQRTADSVKCAVRKDGGDDPDVTTGALIYAEVRLSDDEGIRLDGGAGVGRVTRPGLDQPVGEAAINSVPRKMIKQEVAEAADAYGYEGGFDVIISVPGGEEIAARTFNPRLGIEGGISIIGTSGVVEPMSEKAILDTIKVELRQQKAEGCKVAFTSPGNYGLDFMKENYDMDLDRSVKCSNYIGLTVDMIKELGFEGMLICDGLLRSHESVCGKSVFVVNISDLGNFKFDIAGATSDLYCIYKVCGIGFPRFALEVKHLFHLGLKYAVPGVFFRDFRAVFIFRHYNQCAQKVFHCLEQLGLAVRLVFYGFFKDDHTVFCVYGTFGIRGYIALGLRCGKQRDGDEQESYNLFHFRKCLYCYKIKKIS